MKGQIISHMILLGIGALLVAGMALTINTVREEQTAGLASLQAAQVCERVKLTVQDIWSPTKHATGEPFNVATRTLDLPTQIGGESYTVTLSSNVVSIVSETTSITCSIGVPATGSGSGTATVQLTWTRSGGQDLIELV